MTAGTEPAARFDLLSRLYSDDGMAQIFSESSAVAGWLDTEAALALAQADAGVLARGDADLIAAAAVPDSIDLPRLWREARVVGYPILPLVRMVAAALPAGPAGRVHYGATTQDIMDTGLAQQLSKALTQLDELVVAFGDLLAAQVSEHAGTVMAGRTHAQQAVPTTFGAKLAVFLCELQRHRKRISQARPRICTVSLYGAGGTSAALGPHAAQIRAGMAERLGLLDAPVPWHVARDGVSEFGHLCASLLGTCARFAREVIDLSRTEIGELREESGHHRGASSTMPQKANPVLSEAIVGLAATGGAVTSALYRAMEAGHERAAGEWHVEWAALPQLANFAATALALASELAAGMVVNPTAMTHNLAADGGAILAEAHMMALAGHLGRETAHDVVYAAVLSARANNRSLSEELATVPEAAAASSEDVTASSYLGLAPQVCASALEQWRGATWSEARGRPTVVTT